MTIWLADFCFARQIQNRAKIRSVKISRQVTLKTWVKSRAKTSDVIYGCTLCKKLFGNFWFGLSQFFLKNQEATIVFEIQNNFHFDANQNKKSFDVVSFQVGNSKYVFKTIRIFFSQVIAFLNGIPPLN